MASRRFVDRGFWTCRELNRCSVHARLLAVYLFSSEADDFGRIKDDPYRMQHGCFPDEKLAQGEVEDFVDELVEAGFVKRYFARDDRPLLWLPTFQQYQPRKYWATSYLDRHPDDDFVVVDAKTVKGKKIKESRPLSPMGHVSGTCAVSPQSATTCDKSPQVASPIPIPIPIPMSARDSTDCADVAGDVESDGSIHARREVSRRVGNGVPSLSDFDKTSSITAPPGVVAEDWWHLLRMTAPWPIAGKDGGLEKLAAILKANGPKDAEAYIAKADRCWQAGGVEIGPWAIFATGFQPTEGDRDGVGGNGKPRKPGKPETLGNILDGRGITG